MLRADSLEKTLMLGKIEGRRRRGWQRMRWLDGITTSTDMSLSKLQRWWRKGNLACCSPWGRKEVDMVEGMNNNRYRLALSSRDTEQRQGKDKDNTYEVIIRGGLPRWCNSKESAYQCRRYTQCGFEPWVGKIPWSKKWQPTPILLPEKFHGQRSLLGYSLWGCKEVDITELTHNSER